MMRVYSYNEIETDTNAFSASIRFKEAVKEQVQRKYKVDIEKDGICISSARIQLYKMLSLKPGLVENKLRVLDLGCGRVNGDCSYQKTAPRQYEPWPARLLHELGVPVIGIDLGGLDSEEFEHYACNLLDDGALAFLSSNSIDFANAACLFNSPALRSCAYLWEPERQKQVGRELKARLIPQLERIVRPDGFFIYQGEQKEE